MWAPHSIFPQGHSSHRTLSLTRRRPPPIHGGGLFGDRHGGRAGFIFHVLMPFFLPALAARRLWRLRRWVHPFAMRPRCVLRLLFCDLLHDHSSKPLGRLRRSARALTASGPTLVGPLLGQADLRRRPSLPGRALLLPHPAFEPALGHGSRCQKPHRGERGFSYPAEPFLVRSLPSAEWKSPLPQRHGTRRSSPTLVDSSSSFRGAKRQCPWYLSPSQL